jgi:hypothetical protein
MNGWAWFWSIFLLASIAVFAAVAVVVAIGGFRDVRTMLQRIKEQHED